MIKTPNLNLPIYNTPTTDKFNLEDWNIANENIERAFTSVLEDKTLDIVNSEVLEARKGEASLGIKIDKIGSSLEQNKNQTDLMNLFNGNVKCVAHRGAEMIAPENTYQAFLRAGEMGFWGAECDVQWTSDNVPVIYHDEDISSLTNGTGTIPSKTLTQLKAFNLKSGNKLSFYGGGLRICTFEEYLKVCKKYNMYCFIELKYYGDLTDNNINSLVTLIEKYKMEKYSVIMHINKNSLLRFRDRNDNLTLMLMVEDDHSQANLEWIIENQPCYAGCNFNHVALTEEVVTNYHKNKIPVAVYTMDKLFDAQLWTKKNVDVLISRIYVGGEV